MLAALSAALWSFSPSSLAIAARELTILSVGAVETGLRAVAARFGDENDTATKITFLTAAQVRQHLAGNETWDIVVAPPLLLDELEAAGRVRGARAPLGRVGLGVAVGPRTPPPDVSTVEALKRSVLTADAIAISRGTSGIYVEELLKRLEVFDLVREKLSRHDDGHAVFQQLLRDDRRMLGFGQPTEMSLYRDRGLRFAGLLPEEVQSYATYAAMSAHPSRPGVDTFLQFLATAPARALLAAAGVER
jgi:molybdate transport system substrate-binding protein